MANGIALPAPRAARADSLDRRRRRAGLLFVAPVFAFLCAVIVFPLGHAFWTSMHRVRGLATTFIGFENYFRVLGDETFWHSLGNSIVDRKSTRLNSSH